MFGKSFLVAGLAALVLSPAAALAGEGRREPPRRERDERVVVVTGGGNTHGNRGERDCDDRRGYRPAPPRDCDRPVIVVREQPRHRGHWDWRRHHQRQRCDVVRPGFVVIGRIGF